ncbi:hypothetical protein OAG52_04525, partial [Verrucomicrobia bacterium]|nr:hypothetical protein [Verrucomicrobiota bacterium]
MVKGKWKYFYKCVVSIEMGLLGWGNIVFSRQGLAVAYRVVAAQSICLGRFWIDLLIFRRIVGSLLQCLNEVRLFFLSCFAVGRIDEIAARFRKLLAIKVWILADSRTGVPLEISGESVRATS